MNSVEKMFDRAPEIVDRLTHAGTWESGARHWPSGEQQTLTCCRIVDETHDVKSFEFRTEDGLPVRFEPGQFMTVSANVQGHTVERCYTISSPPTRPYLVSITVKRVPGGVMSNWLHDNMKPGGSCAHMVRREPSRLRFPLRQSRSICQPVRE
ncbi:NAD(P)H-flavin reductase [Paraburkholderia sp. 35.1]